jgi:predicted nucleotidyltransferase component of viral defense system
MNMSIKFLPFEDLELLATAFEINPAFLEKDWYTQHILGVLTVLSSTQFQLVFGGDTSLSKGYQIIQHFSEDIDKVPFRETNYFH